MTRYVACLFFLQTVFISCDHGEKKDYTVRVVGAMRNVMWKGELGGTIDLDTLSKRDHLFGLGPLENLSGELMIVDGRSYMSKVLADTSIQVEETFQAKAPFFVYAQVKYWKDYELPDSVNNAKLLEAFIEKVSRKVKDPFAFKLEGFIENSRIHVVNLPLGSEVKSPEDAHQGQRNYNISSQQVIVLGFFSKKHKGIFTHHDSNVHMHLLTTGNSMMGHVDQLRWSAGKMRLYLPEF